MYRENTQDRIFLNNCKKRKIDMNKYFLNRFGSKIYQIMKGDLTKIPIM